MMQPHPLMSYAPHPGMLPPGLSPLLPGASRYPADLLAHQFPMISPSGKMPDHRSPASDRSVYPEKNNNLYIQIRCCWSINNFSFSREKGEEERRREEERQRELERRERERERREREEREREEREKLERERRERERLERERAEREREREREWLRSQDRREREADPRSQSNNDDPGKLKYIWLYCIHFGQDITKANPLQEDHIKPQCIPTTLLARQRTLRSGIWISRTSYTSKRWTGVSCTNR